MWIRESSRVTVSRAHLTGTRFATHSRKFANDFGCICTGMQRVCADLCGFATHSRMSSTRFTRIRGGFATDSPFYPHNLHIFARARVRDGYTTVRRVKSANCAHVARPFPHLRSA
eukprot:7391675-Prymnesium_polylepis.2